MSREVGFETDAPKTPRRDRPADEWRGILGADEEILWQGRSTAGFNLADIAFVELLMGVVFVYIGYSHGLVMYISTGEIELSNFIPMAFGIVGIYNVLNATVWKLYVSGRKYYTLTNAHGVIGMLLPFGRKRLKTYPVNIDPEYFEIGDGLSRVTFSRENWTDSDGDKQSRIPSFDRVLNGLDAFKPLKNLRSKDGE